MRAIRTDEIVQDKLKIVMEKRDLSGAVKARLKRIVSAQRAGLPTTTREMLFVNSIYRRYDLIKIYDNGPIRLKEINEL